MRRWLFSFAAAVSLVLCLAAVTLWVAAQWRVISLRDDPRLRWEYFDKRYDVTFERAKVVVWWYELVGPDEARTTSSQYLSTQSRGFAFVRAPDGAGPSGYPWLRHGLLAFPYWFAVLVFAALPAWWLSAWHRRRRRAARRAAGQCVACGYDLRASPDRCPECGALAAAAVDNGS